MMLICLLHLLYLSVIPLLVSMAGILVITVVATVADIPMDILAFVVSYTILAIMSLLIFFSVMRISKRMQIMINKAKEINKWLYAMLQWVVIVSIVLTFASLVFVGSAYEETISSISLVISWILQIWWLCLAAVLVWKASEYVYSKIKITMMDGEILYFDCSPKVCRVYRNYIRILKRDENDIVVQEMQINEIAIKQIEYTK